MAIEYIPNDWQIGDLITKEKMDHLEQGVQLACANAGVQGPQGEKGDTGPQGPKGDKGDKGDPGPGVPAGGSVDQILIKKSVADYDTEWVDFSIDAPTGDEVTISPPTGMNATTVQEAVDELFTSVGNGKKLIASVITDKGVETSADASFSTLAQNIQQISTGGNAPTSFCATIEIEAKNNWTVTATHESTVLTTIATNGVATFYVQEPGIWTIAGSYGNQTSYELLVEVQSIKNFLKYIGTLSYVGEISTGDRLYYNSCAGGNGHIALFIGGSWVNNNNNSKVITTHVKRYNNNLIFSLLEELPVARNYIGNTLAYNNNYLLIAGGTPTGSTASYYPPTKIVLAYDNNGIQHTTTTNLPQQINEINGANVGEYAILAGGNYYTGSKSTIGSGYCYSYDESLTYKRLTDATVSIGNYNTMASTNNYAFTFGGSSAGYGGTQSTTYSKTVVSYDKNLIKKAPTDQLSQGIVYGTAVGVENLAIVAGGQISSSSKTTVVTSYDASLTRKLLEELTVAKVNMTATKANKFAIFFGGRTGSNYSSAVNTIEVYDQYGVKVSTESLEGIGDMKEMVSAKGAFVGNYAIFRDGLHKDGTYSSEAYAFSG